MTEVTKEYLFCYNLNKPFKFKLFIFLIPYNYLNFKNHLFFYTAVLSPFVLAIDTDSTEADLLSTSDSVST